MVKICDIIIMGFKQSDGQNLYDNPCVGFILIMV